MKLLSFSMSSLQRDGRWWVRIGTSGPGIHIARFDRHPHAFSLRMGLLKHRRIGPWIVMWLLALLMACGASAESDQDRQREQLQDQATPVIRARHWCCGDSLEGESILVCGSERKPEGAICYCAGVVSTGGAACEDEKQYEPGTLCTAGDLICW